MAEAGSTLRQRDMLCRLRIGARLALGFGLVVLLVVGAAAAGHRGLRVVVRATGAIFDGHSEVAQSAAHALAHARAMRVHERDVVLFADRREAVAAALAAWRSARGALEQRLDHLDRLAADPEERRALGETRKALSDYVAGFERVSAMVESGRVAGPRPAADLLGDHAARGGALDAAAARMAERADARQAAEEQRIPILVRRVTGLALGAMAVAVIVAAAVAVVLTRSITRPMEALVRAAERASRGELPEPVPLRGADETARLVAAFNGVTTYLRDMAAAAEGIALGDLGQALEPRSEGDVLSRAFHEMTGYLRSMANAAEAISQGNLRGELTPKSDRDVLGWAFAEMTGYLRAIARTADAIARGDLRVEVQPKSELDVLGRAFANMVTGLRSLVGQVRQGASQVAVAAAEIEASSGRGSRNAETTSTAIAELTATMLELSANVQQVADHAHGQSACAAETAAAVQQMVGSARRISERTAELAELARRSGEAVAGGHEAVARSAEAVAGGRRAVERSATGMARISAAIGGSAEAVEGLGRRAQEIGRIVAMIDEITGRTNLLALNAAIIAAQAGEQGRGFAVVASEVRALAERSAGSTREIGTLVAAMQEETLAAVAHMQASRDSVSEGLAVGDEVRAALGRIDAAAGDVRAALGRIEETVAGVRRYTEEIGTATREQAAGGAQVEREMTGLTDVARQIQGATGEQAGAASEVAGLAERMRGATQENAESAGSMATAARQLTTNAERLTTAVARFQVVPGGAPGR